LFIPIGLDGLRGRGGGRRGLRGGGQGEWNEQGGDGGGRAGARVKSGFRHLSHPVVVVVLSPPDRRAIGNLSRMSAQKQAGKLARDPVVMN
jgi:hypothetical protein